MSRVVITGATGFLGGALARHLAGGDLRPVAMGRDPAKLAQLEADAIATVRADLATTSVSDLVQTLAPFRPNAIVHCAGLSAPFGRWAAFEQANVAATRTLLDAAGQLGVSRFVYISSPTVYFSFADQMDVPESHPLPAPVNAYAESKARAEAMVLACPALAPVVLRPRGLYGAGDKTLLPRMMQAARKRPLPLLRGGAACIDLTHIDDAVAACVAAITAGARATGETFNISGGDVQPIRTIVDQTCARVGLTPRWRALPLPPLMALARGMERLCLALPHAPEPPVTRYTLGLFAYAQSLNLTKAQHLLGWSPRVDFATGLARTFAGTTP